jgi:hypothetical protein
VKATHAALSDHASLSLIMIDVQSWKNAAENQLKPSPVKLHMHTYLFDAHRKDVRHPHKNVDANSLTWIRLLSRVPVVITAKHEHA